MKTIIFYVSLFFISTAIQDLQAQEKTVPQRIEQLEQQKDKVISEEKEALKKEVEKINQRLEDREIGNAEAKSLKNEAAKKHALNIENRIEIIDNQIALLTRNETAKVEDVAWDNEIEEEEEDRGNWYNSTNNRYHNHDSRTTMSLLLAAGLNNAIEKDVSIDNSDFQLGGSRFFEIGLAWKTRVFNNSNWLRLNYGFSFQFNGLKPTDNRYFVENGDLTELEFHSMDLDKSKFRMDNLVFPVHFEIGSSTKMENDGKMRFSTYNKFKIGFGGYAGFNIGERQKLKYQNDGNRVKEKLKNDFHTNDIIYGLSGYLGWGGMALYVKYDLNPIFEEPNVELNNISVGLRFDVD